MKNLVLFLSVSVAIGLFFVNLYNSLVDARSWGNHIPGSISTARDYFNVVNPGTFFRIFSPLNQLLAIVALILFWKTSGSVRLCLALAAAMYFLAEGLTFGYFFPRNDIMFRDAALTDVSSLQKAWSEWSMMNWVRTSVLAVGIVFSFLSLHKIYSIK